MPSHLKNDQFSRNAKRYKSYYINRFMSMKCAVDLLQNKIFPNAKEITESFGAFEATKKLDQSVWDLSRRDITVVCVGDGHTPRTAATFAFRSNWDCIAVDPEMRKVSWPRIKRLECHRSRIQDVQLNFNGPTLICCVHAHVKLEWCLDAIKAPIRALIGIPCCNPYILKYEADESYEDDNVWSPKNLIKIWKSL